MKAYTDIEQSKKLAEILPIESADMFWRHVECKFPKINFWKVETIQRNFKPYSMDIPCWSLAALLGVMPKGEGKDLSLVFGSYDGGYHPLWFCTYEEVPMILEICSADNPIDACVEMIFKLKENNLL